MKQPRYWKPLVRAYESTTPQELIEHTMDVYSVDEAGAIKILEEADEGCEIWVNDLFQVELRRYPDSKMIQLNIRRRDGSCDIRDWRHFQAIKNQLVGEECEGVELYPAESRLVDTSNKWHLWCIDDPTFRFPIGWKKRDVTYDSGKCAGMKQRPL